MLGWLCSFGNQIKPNSRPKRFSGDSRSRPRRRARPISSRDLGQQEEEQAMDVRLRVSCSAWPHAAALWWPALEPARRGRPTAVASVSCRRAISARPPIPRRASAYSFTGTLTSCQSTSPGRRRRATSRRIQLRRRSPTCGAARPRGGALPGAHPAGSGSCGKQHTAGASSPLGDGGTPSSPQHDRRAGAVVLQARSSPA